MDAKDLEDGSSSVGHGLTLTIKDAWRTVMSNDGVNLLLQPLEDKWVVNKLIDKSVGSARCCSNTASNSISEETDRIPLSHGGLVEV